MHSCSSSRKRSLLGESFSKKVCLIKNNDECTTFSDFNRLERKSEIVFLSSMTQDDVQKKIQEIIPYLENKRFSCAALVWVDSDHKRLEFHGPRRVWDGKTIKTLIKGKSNLYIVEEEVKQPTSSVTHGSLTTGKSERDTSSFASGVFLNALSFFRDYGDECTMSDISDELVPLEKAGKGEDDEQDSSGFDSEFQMKFPCETTTTGKQGEGPIEKVPDKTNIHEGTVTSEGTHWELKAGAVHLVFPPYAVSEPTSIVVHKWNCSACSPPLREHEAVVSNVIEISTIASQGLVFTGEVKLLLSHSAPDLQGYELVIKSQIDKESNEWEDVGTTEDLRRRSDIEDDYPSPEDIPDVFFPFAQADIFECSTYAVVCRLKSSPTYTITSNGGTFNHPDYPDVTVAIPKKAVERNVKFSLELKVQEVPSKEFEGQHVFIGPVLRIICSHVVQFLKPVTIQLPVSLRDEHKGIPDLSTLSVRVLSFGGECREWIEITDHLLKPARFDGTFVWFQVEHFSGFVAVWCREKINGIIRYLSSLIWNQPTLAAFFAYFAPLDIPVCEDILNLELICCTAHDREKVMQELRGDHVTPSWESSNKDMIPGHDKAFVFVSGGISPVFMKDIEDFYLRCERRFPFKKQLQVILLSSRDQSLAQVEFRSTPESTGGNLLAKLNLRVPRLPTSNVDPTAREELTRPQHHGEELTRSQQHGEELTRSQQHVVKEGSPSWDELEDFSNSLGTFWESLARRLGFQEGEITGFHKDNEEYAKKALKMLFEWKERNGSAATYEALYEALCHPLCHRKGLAEEFCCTPNEGASVLHISQ